MCIPPAAAIVTKELESTILQCKVDFGFSFTRLVRAYSAKALPHTPTFPFSSPSLPLLFPFTSPPFCLLVVVNNLLFCVTFSLPFSGDEGASDLFWQQSRRLRKKVQRFQRSLEAEKQIGYYHFKGLTARPVKALSFPYLCEPSNAGNDDEDVYNFMHQQQGYKNVLREDQQHEAWRNFCNAKETHIVL